MRIVSQDRDYSVDFDRTPFWLEGQCIYATVGNKSIMLAAYKYADRAKEVFLEMHDAYAQPLPKMPEFEPSASVDDMISRLNSRTEITPAVLTVPHDEECECVYNPCSIYYMPEE